MISNLLLEVRQKIPYQLSTRIHACMPSIKEDLYW